MTRGVYITYLNLHLVWDCLVPTKKLVCSWGIYCSFKEPSGPTLK